MTIAVTHGSQATGTNNAAKQVSVNAWNADHSLLGDAASLLGFKSNGTALGVSLFTPQMYGATVDGVVDDTAAINAMFAAMPSYGGTAYFPRGFYRITSRIVVPKSVVLLGAGDGTRNLVFGEPAVVNGWEAYTGAVILCDNDVPGFLFPTHTDVVDVATVLANRGATGSNATYWQYPGALDSRVSGLTLYSKGGTSVTAHGIEVRAIVHLASIRVIGFGGDGFKITATADTPSAGSAYGNASESTLVSCQALSNRGDGIHLIGRDCNIVKLDSCEARGNGGWGFNDEALLGNTYINCHASVNNTLYASYPTRGASANVNLGSFRSTGTAAPNVYFGCYAEGGNGSYYDLDKACQIFGGILSGIANGGAGVPYVQRGGIATQAALTHINTNAGLSYDLAIDVGGTTVGRVLAFGTNENGEDLTSGDRNTQLAYFPTPHVWSLEWPNIAGGSYMNLPTFRTNVRKAAPSFPNGLYLGALDSSIAPTGQHIGFTAAGAPPNGTYAAGDITLKAAPTAGGKIGWVCVTAGTKAGNWVTGTNYFPNVSPSYAEYVTNAGNVYRVTTKGGGTSTNAPVHVTGTVTEADGYAWLWLNASTAPVFKEWGAIDA